MRSLDHGRRCVFDPGDYLTVAAKHSIRNILDRSLIVVQASARKLQSEFGSDIVSNPGYRQALIETAIVTNAALSAYSLQQEFIANALPGSRAAYGVYILETREIWAPCSGNIKGTGLAPAACDAAEFSDFGDAIVKSERIATYLNKECYCRRRNLFPSSTYRRRRFAAPRDSNPRYWSCPMWIRLAVLLTSATVTATAVSPVAAAHPITGGSAPAAPPMTMFCGVDRFSQAVYMTA